MRKFQHGDRVTKIRGSSWTGIVVGFYSTKLTPDGVCVESENETGSVQIYPASALMLKPMMTLEQRERTMQELADQAQELKMGYEKEQEREFGEGLSAFSLLKTGLVLKKE